MNYRIPILIYALASGQRCHAQCPHLVLFVENDSRVTVCAAFRHELLKKDGEGRVLRCRQCMGAEKSAARRSQQNQMDLFGGAK